MEIKKKKMKETFRQLKKRHICNRLYTDEDIRVRDHCQIINKYKKFDSSNLQN